jgi:GcrA cell cycle regulator
VIWTEDTRAALRELWAAGHSTAQIAVLLMQRFPDSGVCNKNSVVGKAHRLGLTARASPIPRIRAEQAERGSVRKPETRNRHVAADSVHLSPPEQKVLTAALADSVEIVKEEGCLLLKTEQEVLSNAGPPVAQEKSPKNKAKTALKAPRPPTSAPPSPASNIIPFAPPIVGYTPHDPHFPFLPHPRRCQWFAGHGRQKKQCESEKMEGRAYCAEHAARCYVQRQPKPDTLKAADAVAGCWKANF